MNFLGHLPLWKSTIALSVMLHFVSGTNFLRNFANLLMIRPVTLIASHSHQLFISFIATFTIHHSFSLPLPAQNSIFSINSSHRIPFRTSFTDAPFPDLISSSVFAALHGISARSSYEKGVSTSVRLSVSQTCGLWENARKICPDFYTIRKII